MGMRPAPLNQLTTPMQTAHGVSKIYSSFRLTRSIGNHVSRKLIKSLKKKRTVVIFRNGHAEKRETSIMEALKVPQPCSVQILPMISHESQRVSTCRISFARGFSQDKHRRQSTSKNVARPAFENDRRQPAFSSLLLLPEIFHRLSNSLSYISIFHVNGTRESIIILRRVYDESTN